MIFYGLEIAPIHGINTNEKLKILWINIFHVMFHYY
jgi:hypothetical protein